MSLPDLNISLRVNINKNNFRDFMDIYNLYQTEDWHRNIYPYPGIIREDGADGCRLCYDSYDLDEIVRLYEYFKQNGVNLETERCQS